MALTDAILTFDSTGTMNSTAVASAAAFAAALRTAIASLPAFGGRIVILPSSFTSNGHVNCYEWDATPCAVAKVNAHIEAWGVRVRFADSAHQYGIQFNRGNSGIVGLTCIEDNATNPPARRSHIAFRQVSGIRCDNGYVEHCTYLYLSTTFSSTGGNAMVSVENHTKDDLCRGFRVRDCTVYVGTGATGPTQANLAYSALGYPTHPSLLIAAHVAGLTLDGCKVLNGATDVSSPSQYFGALAIMEECPYSQVSNNHARNVNFNAVNESGAIVVARKYGPAGQGGVAEGGFEGHHTGYTNNRFEECVVGDFFRLEGAHFDQFVGNMLARSTVTGAAINVLDQTTYSAPAGSTSVQVVANNFHNLSGPGIRMKACTGIGIGVNSWALLQQAPRQIHIEADCRQLRFRAKEQDVAWTQRVTIPHHLWLIESPELVGHRDASEPSNDWPNF